MACDKKHSKPACRQHDCDKSGYRTPFERDRDRVLYSTAFRRLDGVSQIAAVSERRVLHNRLTHSLKVGQIARRIAQRLKREHKSLRAYVKPDVSETAGLAHDLGHPPFGHTAEKVLDDLTRSVSGLDGFEGNAQTFRIVCKLAKRRGKGSSLDLTRASLDAILKYPLLRFEQQSQGTQKHDWTDRRFGTKWGVYETEEANFAWTRIKHSGHMRCANAVIMDWADDVTFATHDIEDYFRAGLIPLHDLRSSQTKILDHITRRHPGQFDMKSLTDAFTTLESFTVDRPFDGSKEDRIRLNDVTSHRIGELVKAVIPVDDFPYINVTPEAQYMVEILKELTWYYVIDTPPVQMAREGQKQIIEELYAKLSNFLLEDPRAKRVPIALQEIYKETTQDLKTPAIFRRNEEAVCARSVCDYIASLTESQAIDMHQRITGASPGSIFGTWFQ